jgi:hypothetical protein
MTQDKQNEVPAAGLNRVREVINLAFFSDPGQRNGQTNPASVFLD